MHGITFYKSGKTVVITGQQFYKHGKQSEIDGNISGTGKNIVGINGQIFDVIR